MKGYALARLDDDPNPHPEVLEYIEKIQPTLEPFSGRFIIHGGTTEVLEGEWSGSTVMIEFPSVKLAREWYDSAAYREISRLRADHLSGSVIIVEGVPDDYDPAEKIAKLREAG